MRSIRKFEKVDGWNPLHKAAASGKADVVESLLIEGCPVDETTRNGWTALDWAISVNSLSCVKHLLAAGATVSHFSLRIALEYPRLNGTDKQDIEDKKQIITLLINKGATIESTFLSIATKNQPEEIVSFLLEQGADPDYVVDSKSKTPLHYTAARFGEESTALLLLTKMKTKPRGVLHAAAGTKNNENMLKLMIAFGYSPDDKDDASETPLDQLKADAKKVWGYDDPKNLPQFKEMAAVLRYDSDTINYLRNCVHFLRRYQLLTWPNLSLLFQKQFKPVLNALIDSKVDYSKQHSTEGNVFDFLATFAPTDTLREYILPLLEKGCIPNNVPHKGKSLLKIEMQAMTAMTDKVIALFRCLLKHQVQLLESERPINKLKGIKNPRSMYYFTGLVILIGLNASILKTDEDIAMLANFKEYILKTIEVFPAAFAIECLNTIHKRDSVLAKIMYTARGKFELLGIKFFDSEPTEDSNMIKKCLALLDKLSPTVKQSKPGVENPMLAEAKDLEEGKEAKTPLDYFNQL